MEDNRPDWNSYFLQIAKDVSKRSNCSRRQIGAILVKEHRIISTGYNGTPYGIANCSDGGCPRCSSQAGTMSSYDTCLCVHAEENAIALAARHGSSTDGCVLHCTCRPCFGCLKLCIQAGIKAVYYEDEHIYPDPDTEAKFQKFVKNSGLLLYRLKGD